MSMDSDDRKTVYLTFIVFASIISFIVLLVWQNIYMETKRLEKFPQALLEARECDHSLDTDSNNYIAHNEQVLKCYEGVRN